MKPIRIPWDGPSNPHGLLDIIRKCNISCRGCYNIRSTHMKSLEKVKHDFDQLLQQRKLDSVTITGGEVTLHPDLVKIVKYVSSKGVKSAVITNGLLLKPELISQLKDAGVRIIMVHVQRDQKRSDLPEDATQKQIDALREQKLRIIHEGGVEAGIAYTIYRNRLDELKHVLSQIKNTEYINYTLLTIYRNFEKFGKVSGTIPGDLLSNSENLETEADEASREIETSDLLDILKESGFTPFSYIAANNNPKNKRWHAFLMGTVYNGKGAVYSRSLSPSLLEKTILHTTRIFRKKGIFIYEPNIWRFRMQLILNSFLGGNIITNFNLLIRTFSRKLRVQDKHILLQQPPDLLPDGSIVYCRDCPDAVVKNGKLVPYCLVDRVVVN